MHCVLHYNCTAFQILFRCNDGTGCCASSADTCVQIESQTIEVIFFVWNSTQTQTIVMTNHTKCGCKKRLPNNAIDAMMSVKHIQQSDNTLNTSLIVFLIILLVIVVIVMAAFVYNKCRKTHTILVNFSSFWFIYSTIGLKVF